jgi:hypothetical protein
MISQFFIINKSGGMIYSYEKSTETDVNDLLVLTSTLHSINVITTELLKQHKDLQIIYNKKNVFSLYKTLTHLSFVFVGNKPISKSVFLKVLSLFCSYVSRNPFYCLDMPISHGLFDFYCRDYLSKK